ncbi:Lon protease C-terminal proteolytic domain-containing protein [Suillus paluster]|uniref:Lon protease C-terminal proteolytic domain-containing protein n=1 Tax=Suillus paluster TaxID=48578 RepID=UPI001B86131C|nr:Lon protease C-terminal proteolytic domain-containing protein [Suillus paluster]KAG1744645.1 Lon protease C-terminal proteolytic domain-containing protein [Suillus paluster]
MVRSSLPVLLLPHPLILIPTARITIQISRTLADSILTLLDESDKPLLAVIPTPSEHNSEITHGTAARVARLVRPRSLSSPNLLSLYGLARIRLSSPPDTNSPDTLPLHDVIYSSGDGTPSRETVETFKDAALTLLDRLAKDSLQPQRRDDWLRVAAMVEDISEQRAAWMADVLVAAVSPQYPDKLAFLAATDVEDRLRRATELFIKQSSIQEVSKKIATAVDESLSRQQKEYFLRQQLAAIQRELHSLHDSPATAGPGFGTGGANSELDDDDQADADDLADLRRKIEALDVGSEERKVGVREWRRLKRIPQGSVENGVIRSYLEWLTSVPWPSTTTITPLDVLKDHSFLTRARAQLDADHYGLDQIKRRLMEYLAVVRLRAIADASAEPTSTDLVKADSPPPPPKNKGVKGPILLFVGPPGTGKTSLGQSIAKALGRPFQRISLGGVRDEAEIRGHRRTYVASGPGAIVQALRKAGRNDPVILLDEVDKVGHSNFHGDPAAALLEVLDPEQNHSFNDHYINVPIDLSQVLFICTSNTLETISAPLLDRCEVVELSGYTYDEKTHIAKRFLLPKQIRANGLSDSQLTLSDGALLHVATMYTREAGVRSLERAIGAVVRFKAVEWAEWLDARGVQGGERTIVTKDEQGTVTAKDRNGKDTEWRSTVEPHELEAILGIPRFDIDELDREEKPGIVYGLVVTGMGEGGILPVESTALPGTGRLKLTGSLGEVLKESGEIALSWVKTHAFELGITNGRGVDPLKAMEGMGEGKGVDVHLHLPAGAQRKDGPSAGIAMICAFVSLLTGLCVPKDIAMTGEITLRGRITPVGGVRMKVLGAHRAQIRKVILPYANRKDVEHDVALEVRREMQFFFVRTIDEALEAAFGRGVLGWRRETVLLESRL